MTFNLAQFIGAIAQLRGLNLQQQQIDQSGQALTDQQRQLAFKAVGDAPMEARASILESFRRRLPEGDWNALNSYAGTSGETSTTIRDALAAQGVPDEGPNRDQFSKDVATQMFTGQGRGQIAQGRLIEALTPSNLSMTFGEAMTKGFQQGMVQRMATGETPMQAGQGAAYLGQTPQAQAAQAAIAGGTQVGAPQLLQAQVTREGQQLGYQGQMADTRQRSIQAAGQQGVEMARISAELANARAAHGMTPQVQANLMNDATKVAEQLAKGGVDPNMQKMYAAQWNTYMDMLGMPDRKIKPGDDIPSKVGGIRALFSNMIGQQETQMEQQGAPTNQGLTVTSPQGMQQPPQLPQVFPMPGARP